MSDRLTEIRARLDAATFQPDERGFGAVQMWSDGTITVYGPGNAEMLAHAPADIAWLLERESQMMGALAVMTDLAAYDGGAIGRESLDECLRDFGFTLDEVEARDER